ncbi:MAG: homocysteine S-methyltransferase family protein [Anaerolineae bacterium]|jgi:betaine-homocysteine S-methyltransferase
MSDKRGILERLETGVVLGAEGYVFELERRGYVQAGPYVPEVVLEQPEAVKALHREFLHAGAEVMVALTYYAHREKMKAIGREGELGMLNRQALRLAREVAAEGDALVAGNLSNTWVYDHNRPEETAKIVRGMFEEQVGWAVEEGADFVIAETLDYVAEGLIALEVIQAAGLPAMITFGSVRDDTKDGYSLLEACRIAAGQGAEIVGLNCSRGPGTMLPLIAQIREAVDCHVAAQPVAYRTTEAQPTFQALKEESGERGFPIALDPFQTTRFEMADFARRAQEMGVEFIGTCCGAAPHHVRSMAEALGRTVPASRYSPDMSMHPMLGAHVQERDESFLEDWKD